MEDLASSRNETFNLNAMKRSCCLPPRCLGVSCREVNTPSTRNPAPLAVIRAAGKVNCALLAGDTLQSSRCSYVRIIVLILRSAWEPNPRCKIRRSGCKEGTNRQLKVRSERASHPAGRDRHGRGLFCVIN
jgi:hypothetical protein